jgi:hypothetical protein
MAFMAIALVAFLLIVGIAVKLYDVRRTREDEGAALQARLSDALLLDPRLSGVLVVASVHMPLWRGSPPVVELTGAVARPETREIALQLVERELAGSDARIEDRVVVDPWTFKRVA